MDFALTDEQLAVSEAAHGVFTGLVDPDRVQAVEQTEDRFDRELWHALGDADLLGLAVVLKDGSPFGTVKAVHDFGAGDSLEIERPDGVVVLVPFTSASVPAVDIKAGRLVLEPPPGLLDNRPVEVTERDEEV